MSRTIVVFGATGLQGRYLIEFLSAATPAWKIIALTRNPSSSVSKRLSQLADVQVVQVDDDCMEKPGKVFTDLGFNSGDVHGVFSVQGYVDDKTMYRQGCVIADACVAIGVKHLVYSSSDFGGLDDTGIATYEVKRKVENYIKTLSIGYTFLRPAQFMENYLPEAPMMFKMGRTVVMKYTFVNHPERKHQLVSARDIGRAGALAFERGPAWRDGVVRLAGDDGLTVEEIDQVFIDVTGRPVQLAFRPLAFIAKTFVPVLRDMINFFDNHGYNIDVESLKKDMPVEDLRSFLQRQSKH